MKTYFVRYSEPQRSILGTDRVTYGIHVSTSRGSGTAVELIEQGMGRDVLVATECRDEWHCRHSYSKWVETDEALQMYESLVDEGHPEVVAYAMLVRMLKDRDCLVPTLADIREYQEILDSQSHYV